MIVGSSPTLRTESALALAVRAFLLYAGLMTQLADSLRMFLQNHLLDSRNAIVPVFALEEAIAALESADLGVGREHWIEGYAAGHHDGEKGFGYRPERAVQGATLEEKRQLRNRLSEELASEGPQDRPQPKMRIYLNRNNDWTPNKRAAHAVHAALIAVGAHPDCKVIVLDGGPTKIAEMTTVVHDAGHTELAPGTLTAGTNWPEDSEE